ncbi:CDC24 calponin [Coniochaeta sp. 2T2.1]|nr:CDC24 calponin [Coniochaeta sp. 2T2.1]
MAHAPLLRTNTAPVFQHSTDGVARLANTMSMGNAPRQSQLSGSTAFDSSTSLSSLSTAKTAVSNGQVMATSNIINQKADASRSLYQICVALKQRLTQVPGFEVYLEQMEAWAAELEEGGPVESLWRLLRTGVPLLTIFNCLQPEKPLKDTAPVNANPEKRAKINILGFVGACTTQLNPPPPESMSIIINDIIGTDTTGFLKAINLINYVLDIAEQRNLLKSSVQPYPEDDNVLGAGPQMSYRDYVVRELVDTERKYVQDLENLHDLKKTLEERGILPGDVIYQIFLNINAILDFQRRFLIRVETTNSMPQSRQEWGSPFVYYEEAFNIYQPFIANQRKAAQLANSMFDKIQSSGHPVASDFNTLDGFLLKPMQRLVKYPLLLKDLLKKSEDPPTRLDLANGISAAERVLQNANEAVDRDMLDEALDDLIMRVDDWKNHRVEQFGKLLLHGVYTVVTGKSDQEKDYEIYLFECILLCCKEVAPVKTKDKKDKTKSTGPKIRNRHAKLQLKGRIFMTNVTDVVAIAKQGKPGGNDMSRFMAGFNSNAPTEPTGSSYTVQIYWKGDPGVENFMIKFQNEDMMKKWAAGLDQQRKENVPQAQQSTANPAPNFAWMQSVNGLENPYALQQDEDEEDDSYSSTPTTSINRESTQSLAGMVRAPPPRFPLPQPPAPLSLQTQMVPGQQSPGGRQGPDASSYFSPTAESPASSRTSTTSGYFQSGYTFPNKSGTPQPGWDDPQNRYTAPAMPRAPSRDGTPVNGYGGPPNGRNPRGPSMPVMASQSSAAAQAAFQQQRSRSYSTPDINGQQQSQQSQSQAQLRRQNNQSIPNVPNIPPHLTHERHDSNIPRSNSGSPANVPIRSATQSPSVQHQRNGEKSSYSGGASLTQFPSAPIYPRQSTPSNSALPPPSGPLPPPPPAGRGVTAGTSPALPSSSHLSSTSDDFPMPTQLKVKVNCDSGNYVTLVVAFNITYQSLIDRIDAKLNRFTSSSIAKGGLKLRYRDEDGDFVTIEGDEDIQIAISEWREGMREANEGGMQGGVGEIELFCVGEMD